MSTEMIGWFRKSLIPGHLRNALDNKVRNKLVDYFITLSEFENKPSFVTDLMEEIDQKVSLYITDLHNRKWLPYIERVVALHIANDAIIHDDFLNALRTEFQDHWLGQVKSRNPHSFSAIPMLYLQDKSVSHEIMKLVKFSNSTPYTFA